MPRNGFGSFADVSKNYRSLPAFMLVAWCAGALGGTGAGHVDAKEKVENGGFEQGETIGDSGWSWKAMDNAGSIEFCPGPDGEGRAVRIQRSGKPRRWHDWVLANHGRIAVEPGQEWTASALVQYADTERVQLEILALGERRGMPGWRVGCSVRYGSGDWERLQTTATIPQGYNRIYVRLCGVGDTQVRVDDVHLRMGRTTRQGERKRKVEGWAFGQDRVQENLGRGLVARHCEEGRIYIQWRLLNRDPEDVAFNLYRVAGDREPIQLNQSPISETTDFVDETFDPDVQNSYFVRPVANGQQGQRSEPCKIPAGTEASPYRSIALQGDYDFQMVGIGDLNGDGRYDFVIKVPNVNIDPSHHKAAETTYKLEAYLSDGTFLWRRDLGWNIITGIWYSPYVVYDFDGDGRAEVAAKTAPTDKDYREPDGRVRTGPEHLSIFDGMTGKELARAPWPSRTALGDTRLVPRNQIGIAYLDGKTPCILPARGTYTVMKLAAYQFHGGELEELWHWDTSEESVGLYYGQGAHQMHTFDVDGDGRDEVLLGSCAIDDNGQGLWSIGMGHLDTIYVSDIDPARPGLEMYYHACNGDDAMNAPLNDGLGLVDARTGEKLWGIRRQTHHVHGAGLVSDLDPGVPGMECYSRVKNIGKRWVRSAGGGVLAEDDAVPWQTYSPSAVHWDGDLQREMLVGGEVFKYATPTRTITGNIEGHQVAWLDLWGDWREEIITSVPGELRIYATPIPAVDRRASLMQDPLYRSCVVHMAMGYGRNPPLPSFHLPEE